MSIGGGILLIVIGAILSFALNINVGWIDLHFVGYILMAAGVVIVIIGIALLMRRRRTISTTRSGVDPAGGERITRESSGPDDPVV
jgi:uncharacterized protein DUF6458